MDERLIQDNGANVYTGCELLVKGALESNVSLITGYPGSPIAEVFDVIERNAGLFRENGIVAQMANNEALSVARLNGAQMANLRAVAFMKSVGFHVATDALAIGNLAGTTGGAVVVVGDDPGSGSTQVPADSRYLARHVYTPLVEPSTFQEIKDWLAPAFEISVESNLFVTYLVTVNQADGGGDVLLHPNRYPDINAKDKLTLDTDLIDSSNRVVLPPDSARIGVETLKERLPAAVETARKHNLNQIYHAGDSVHELGFVSSGLTYAYLQHALGELGLQGKIPILKFGLTHPIDDDIVREFAMRVREICVIEENRSLLENEVKASLSQLYQNGEIDRFVQVWGKQFPDGLEGIPEMGGLNPSIVMQRLIPLLQGRSSTKLKIDDDRLRREKERINQVNEYQVGIPGRTPTFCPGCPHRDSASVFLDVVKQFTDAEYMKKRYDSPPVDLVFHGDIGCYSMLKYDPYPRLMHNLSAMALGGGTGAGIDPFIKNKQVVFMGDSTFFHGGMAAISDSIKNAQDIAYIILDNQTTAMTGHQPTPSTGEDILGNPTFAQDIEKVTRGLVADADALIVRINPEERFEYKKLLEDAILEPGVKIIIADKECGITYHRRLRREQFQNVKKHGFLKTEKHINITEEVCEFCLECTIATGCPGLKTVETDYGPKIGIDQSDCVSDGACARIKWACPSFEEVTITRKRPPRKSTVSGAIQINDTAGAMSPLPPPKLSSFDETWTAYAAGVGGMGIGTISKILVVAGHIQGYHVQFCDKKGLAIRNGGVYTHVIYSKTNHPISPLVPYGKADLLLGLDILEAVRGIDPKAGFCVAAPDQTAAIVNTAKTETVRSLIGKDDFDIADLEEWIKSYTNTDHYVGVNLFDIAEERLGSKLYANIMLLGVAFQRALIPLELGAMQLALKQMVRPSDLESNLRAFEIGRRLAVHPSDFIAAPEKKLYKDTLREKSQILAKRWRGRGITREYAALVQSAVDALRLDDETNRGLALRVYDLIQFENLKYARLYVEKVRSVYGGDSSDQNYRATKAAIKYLHKVMLIKDEIYVSHLLTSQEKLQRDKERYDIDKTNGDKIKYVHLNRPHFRIMGIDLEGDVSTRNWQLNLMKRMRYLRRWLSQWHANEKSFRDWYVAEVVDTFAPTDIESYEKHLEALEAPEEVRGYREVRYPKMEAAKKKVERLIGNAD